MTKKTRDGDIPKVRAEIIPARRTASVAARAMDAQAMLKKIVEQQVAEIMANRDDLLFQPFLQSRRVADELRRLQTVPELRKWSVYYVRHGCLVCGAKTKSYAGCGMCGACYQRTAKRLKDCAGMVKKHGQDWRSECLDQEDLARRALGALAARKRRSD